MRQRVTVPALSGSRPGPSPPRMALAGVQGVAAAAAVATDRLEHTGAASDPCPVAASTTAERGEP